MVWVQREETVGERVRRHRLRLGMAQADLAAALGRTQGWVSKIESGRLELDRASVINQVASELHCHPNDLIGRPYNHNPLENSWQQSAALIVRELRRFDLIPVWEGQPRASAQLWQEVASVARLRDKADNVSILGRLVDLLREARALAEVSTGREREQAFAIYTHCVKFGHSSAHALGHPELVAISAERGRWSAQLAGDAVGGTLSALASWMRAWDMWASADWSDSITVMDRALETVESGYSAGEPLAMRMYGSIHLRAAIGVSRAGDVDGALARVAEARQAAERLDAYTGERPFDPDNLAFSLGNTLIHAAAAAVEGADHTRALDLDTQARREHPRALAALTKSRRGHHHMDMSRAHLWNGDRDQALVELEKAERTAPQLVRNHPMAHATLRSIIYAERAGTRERLRVLSNRFHLDEQ
ncbi:helix-turn-helix domain-containing protein [Streptomyces sp. MAR4 CNY-716]